MLSGVKGKRPFEENDRGTGPATSVSPAHSAPEIDKPPKYLPALPSVSPPPPELRRSSSVEMEALDEGDAAELEIEAEFRRKLMGLRRLRHGERAQALRAAREWRSFALNALREKRLRERHSRYLVRRQSRVRAPRPS
jgi:hypothetical protein